MVSYDIVHEILEFVQFTLVSTFQAETKFCFKSPGEEV